MPATSDLLAFALVSLAMVLTPGPNMIYVISRSICQGPMAGLISLGGVALGFVFYMLCAALGITALLMARCTCCTWLGRHSSPAAVRRLQCVTCRRTARAGCSRWAS